MSGDVHRAPIELLFPPVPRRLDFRTLPYSPRLEPWSLEQRSFHRLLISGRTGCIFAACLSQPPESIIAAAENVSTVALAAI